MAVFLLWLPMGFGLLPYDFESQTNMSHKLTSGMSLCEWCSCNPSYKIVQESSQGSLVMLVPILLELVCSRMYSLELGNQTIVLQEFQDWQHNRGENARGIVLLEGEGNCFEKCAIHQHLEKLVVLWMCLQHMVSILDIPANKGDSRVLSASENLQCIVACLRWCAKVVQMTQIDHHLEVVVFSLS